MHPAVNLTFPPPLFAPEARAHETSLQASKACSFPRPQGADGLEPEKMAQVITELRACQDAGRRNVLLRLIGVDPASSALGGTREEPSRSDRQGGHAREPEERSGQTQDGDTALSADDKG